MLFSAHQIDHCTILKTINITQRPVILFCFCFVFPKRPKFSDFLFFSQTFGRIVKSVHNHDNFAWKTWFFFRWTLFYGFVTGRSKFVGGHVSMVRRKKDQVKKTTAPENKVSQNESRYFISETSPLRDFYSNILNQIDFFTVLIMSCM